MDSTLGNWPRYGNWSKSLLNTLVDQARFSILMDTRRQPGPGQIILNLPNEKRELIRRLTSEDFMNVRADWWR